MVSWSCFSVTPGRTRRYPSKICAKSVPCGFRRTLNHTSAPCGTFMSGDATPTIVGGWAPASASRSVLPITFGSLPNTSRQSRWEMTTSGGTLFISKCSLVNPPSV